MTIRLITGAAAGFQRWLATTWPLLRGRAAVWLSALLSAPRSVMQFCAKFITALGSFYLANQIVEEVGLALRAEGVDPADEDGEFLPLAMVRLAQLYEKDPVLTRKLLVVLAHEGETEPPPGTVTRALESARQLQLDERPQSWSNEEFMWAKYGTTRPSLTDVLQNM